MIDKITATLCSSEITLAYKINEIIDKVNVLTKILFEKKQQGVIDQIENVDRLKDKYAEESTAEGFYVKEPKDRILHGGFIPVRKVGKDFYVSLEYFLEHTK